MPDLLGASAIQATIAGVMALAALASLILIAIDAKKQKESDMNQPVCPPPVNTAQFRSSREPEKKPGDGSIQARECAEAIARNKQSIKGGSHETL